MLVIAKAFDLFLSIADTSGVPTKLPEREKEIGRRLRAFRQGLGIFRTAFAVSVGIGSDRLASYEAGRVPLRYDIFRAINARYHLSARWLVANEGTVRWDRPFDESPLPDKPLERELLSVAYDRVLAAEYKRLEVKAVDEINGPTGVITAMKNFMAAASDPERRKTIPTDVIEKVHRYCLDLLAATAEAEAEDKRVSKALRLGKAHRRSPR